MSSQNYPLPNARMIGIDIGRFFAVVGVILIHTASSDHFKNSQSNNNSALFGIDAGGIIDQLSRFAVPFFFIVSGFFLERQMHKPLLEIWLHIAKRIIPVYLFWSTLYILASPDRILWFTQSSYIIRWIVNGGYGFHLWFLPSLGISMALAAFLKKHYSNLQAARIAFILYVMGFIAGSYLPVFYPEIGSILKFLARDSPCFGLVFIILGSRFNDNRVPKLSKSIWICSLGALTQLGEAALLDCYHVNPFSQNNYLLGTLPFAVGIFMITLSLNFNSQSKLNTFISSIGSYSLGIYTIHIFFIWSLAYIIHPVELYQRLIIAITTFIISVAFIRVIKQIKYTRFLVR